MEFRLVSDQREGLLLALGQTVIANGFTLLRQRMSSCPDGVQLTMLVRGAEENLLLLEEHLGTHHLVKSFESGPPGEMLAASSFAASTPAAAPAPVAVPVGAARPSSIATERAEIVLPQLARSYPNINILVRALDKELPTTQRAPTLHHVGHRVGAWVYKREYALGGHLSLHDALRRIALPAVGELVHVRIDGDALVVDNSPYCRPGQGAGCHFLRGMLEGLLGGAHGTRGLVAVERTCRGDGAQACRFEFSH
ncbi:hypothetical protein [Marilutibacter alkalisoli]|uniref:4-vinyl reductase 4VR domain-containing protein n=1 Tax=Marilutibacter alkalisoli TaxID=2591633 RepID=A0A514BWY5_9GAMM|nr:hypothetical protein [Lysobacter alkalisoli]QDH71499.1 hypothetical protein FKV23_16415 [Lysobacter alkalisoli]